jgi:hypothetical protein
MWRGTRKRRVAAWCVAFGLIAVSAGCSGLLGFSDYQILPDDASAPPDVVAEAGDGGDSGSCNVNLALQCYPCEPTTTDQLLNACPATGCLPFDQTRLKGFLTADGGLPPLPPPDGG